MVDVTKENFKTQLDSVKGAIKACDFVAIDCEFSGLDESASKNTADVPRTRFYRLRKDALTYSPIQIGLSFFYYKSSEKKYIAEPYNFYVFPFHNSPQYPEYNIVCSTSSLSFLSGHGFDFNKLVASGIPYLSVTKEDVLSDKMTETFASLKKDARISGNMSNNSESKFLAEAKSDNSEFLEVMRDRLKMLKEGNQECEFRELTSFQRKLLFSLVNCEFTKDNLVAITKCVDDNKDVKQRYVLVKKLDVGSQESKLDFEEREKRDDLQSCVGFTEVMKLLSESEKLIVGHNMLMDCMHIFNTFFAPIPQDYDKFRKALTSVFPRMCDTKVLASTKPFKDHIQRSGLEPLFETIGRKPFKKPNFVLPAEFKKYESGKAAHEAGYDAFMTGVVFTTLLNYLGSLIKPARSHISCNSELVKPFVNKIYLMRMMDVYYMDLSGEDVVPPRHDMFHLTIPPSWRTKQVQDLFKPFATSAQVIWVNDTSCFVRIEGMQDPPTTVMKSVVNAAQRDDFSIESFEDYSKAEQNRLRSSEETEHSSQNANGVSPQRRDSSLGKRNPTSKRASPDEAEFGQVEPEITEVAPRGKKMKQA